MKPLNKIFTGIICGALITTNVMAADDCSNLAYKQSHPERCQYASTSDNTLLYVGGGAVAVGAVAALVGLGMGGGGGGSSSSNGGSIAISSTQYVRTINPTMITHRGTAPDLTSAELTSITTRADYVRNTNAYDDIQLAYSIARGYTGANTTIAVFDTDLGTPNSHGAAVMATAQEVAPGATVEHYLIEYGTSPYVFNGNVIAGTNNANVYNNSWNVSGINAGQINTREQLISHTSQNFIDAISDAATTKDAIFVWAAGNDSGKQSGMLSAMGNVMPELDGHFINVVAWDSKTRALADYSNECGVTQNYCITAPGAIKTPDRYIHVGTSFAAPVVSSAIAIIREAWPYLDSAQITDILFTTAADLGDVGIDEIYGHGMLDLEAATRPVGELSIAVSDNVTQPLQTATVSPEIAHSIESANPTMAFFDAYGRAYETKISDNISARNRGLGFERLRGDNARTKIEMGSMEFGFYRSDMLNGTGFMATDGETTTTYVASNQSFNLGNVELFTRAQFGASRPIASSESMISEFSNIYTASASVGVRGNDWSFSIGVPDTMVHGNMTLHTATGRNANGDIIYHDYKINMATAPAIEYSANWRFMTAGFVDNPYGENEFYIFAKTKLHF